MMKILLYILCCACWLLSTVTVNASDVSGDIREGNRLYDQGKFDEAIETYNKAREETPDMDILNFNLGGALYKSGRYQESVEAYTRSLNTEDRKVEADAVYNIANAKYKIGADLSDSDLNSAADQYRDALSYYKRAIEMNKGNSDAKFNHELVERELKVLLDKIKNQPKQEQNQEQNQDQDKENQKDKQEEKQSGEKPDKEEKEDGQQAQNAQDQNEEKTPGEEQQEGNPEQSEEEAGEMTPEEARMLLDAFGEEESLENSKKQRHGRQPSVVKDW